MKRFIEILREAIPQIIATLIAAALLAIVSVIFNNKYLILIGIVMILWLLCIYFAYSRDEAKLIVHKLAAGRKAPKGPYRYPRVRTWAYRATFLIPLLAILIGILYLAYSLQPASKILVLIADFDGPAPKSYRFTETIVQELTIGLEEYDNILVKRANEHFSDRSAARVAGRNQKADIIIWGWYGVTDEASSMSINFEIMEKFVTEYSLCPAAKGDPRIYARNELESYAIQSELSSELTYLVLFTSGMANYLDGEIEKAIENLNEALEAAPKESLSWPIHNVYHLRGYMHHELGNTKLAIADYDKSISIFSNDSEVYFDRAEAHLDLENWEAAVSDWGIYLSMEPEDAYVLYNRGSLNFFLGNYEEAIADFDRAIELEPEVPCSTVEIGYANYLTGDYRKAMANFDYAINQHSSIEGYFGRGLVLYQEGNYEQAIVALTRAIEMAKGQDLFFPAAYQYRGYAYLAINDKDSAKLDLIKFLEIVQDPKDPPFIYFYSGYEENEIPNVEKELDKLIAER